MEEGGLCTSDLPIIFARSVRFLLSLPFSNGLTIIYDLEFFKHDIKQLHF